MLNKFLLALVLTLTSVSSMAYTCNDIKTMQKEEKELVELYQTHTNNSFVQGQILKELDNIRQEKGILKVICSSPKTPKNKEILITIIEENATY